MRRRRGLKPGTVLVREWHGVAHQVRILDCGALYHHERYRLHIPGEVGDRFRNEVGR